MSGKFNGLSDLEWKLFEDLFPEPEVRGRGMPRVPPRKVMNTLLFLLITGCRWCDLPEGEDWGSKSSSHRALQRWKKDGTFERMKERVLGIAEEKGMIQWDYGAVDGSFSPWEGGWGGS